MIIYFDMDGTIANLYQIENWLEKIRNQDTSPYYEASPMLRFSNFARKLNTLQKKGYQIGIISWLSKNSTEEFDNAVSETKKRWLKNHLPSVKFNEIHIVPYGTPKSKVTNQKEKILFDDEILNRAEWEKAGGKAYDPQYIMEILNRF